VYSTNPSNMAQSQTTNNEHRDIHGDGIMQDCDELKPAIQPHLDDVRVELPNGGKQTENGLIRTASTTDTRKSSPRHESKPRVPPHRGGNGVETTTNGRGTGSDTRILSGTGRRKLYRSNEPKRRMRSPINDHHGKVRRV